MTQFYADLVYESTTTTGTGTITLGGAYTANGPAQTFAAGIGTGNTCTYCISNGTNWEVGLGTIGGSGPYTLARTTVYASSHIVSGAPTQISLTGTSYVANVLPAANIPYPFTYEGVWSGSSAYPAYSVVIYNDDIYINHQPIASPTGSSVVVSSATTSSPSSATTWTLSYSTGGANRLVYIMVQINGGTPPAGTVTSVSSPNATWKVTVDKAGTGFGFSNYVAIWQGQAGPQLNNETITIQLGASWAGTILAFDVAGLNFSGTINDPNAAIPYSAAGTGSSGISASFTTSNADDILIAVFAASNTGISNTAPSGFTLIGNPATGTGSIAAFYEVVTATQSSLSVSATGSAYQSWISAGLANEYPGSAGNVTPPNDVRWSRITNLSTMLDETAGSSTGTMLVRGSSIWQGIGPLTNGQLLIGNTSNVPTAATLSAGSNVTITNNPGAITITSSATSTSGMYGGSMSAIPTISSMGLTTWLNQGSATINNHSIGVCVSVPASSGTNIRGQYFTAPGTTPYSFTALLAITSFVSNYAYCQLGWYNGSAALQVFSLMSYGNGLGVGFEVDNWNSATSFNGSAVGLYFQGNNPVWLRIRDDGTTVHFAYSMTGDQNEFIDQYTVAKSSGFLGSSGYSNVFFGGNSQNSGPVYATCMSWTQGT